MTNTMPPDDSETFARSTVAHYNGIADLYEERLRDHDVSQNYAAFLGTIVGDAPFKILDFGCGPGRDLKYFKSLGHDVTGLDGAERFVQIARSATGCTVLHQNFLNLSLPNNHYNGVFANASLFHVPARKLSYVLRAIQTSLAPGGVMLCSNRRGADTDDFDGVTYGAFHSLDIWRTLVSDAGFEEIRHYYRPEGKPRDEQPWLVTVWRKKVGT